MNWPIKAIEEHFVGKRVTFTALEPDLPTQLAVIRSLKETTPDGLCFETTGDAEELIIITRGSEILTYRKVAGEQDRVLVPNAKMSDSGKGIIVEVIEVVRQSRTCLR